MKDYFGKDAKILKQKRLWLLDMDGTIYNEETLFDGTLDLLAAIRARGGRYMYITNNSSRSVADYVKKADRVGFPAVKEDFFTSAQATVLWLRQNHRILLCAKNRWPPQRYSTLSAQPNSS